MPARFWMVTFAAFFIGAAAWIMFPTTGSLTARRIDRAILELPAGSTKEQVTALVRKEGLQNSSSYHRIDKSIDDSFVERSGYGPSVLGGYYGIRVPNTSRAIIGECSTLYHFLFDKKGKLLKTISESGCVGL